MVNGAQMWWITTTPPGLWRALTCAAPVPSNETLWTQELESEVKVELT